MELIEVFLLLIGIILFQSYQLWKLDKKADELLEIVIGLHMGELEITKVEHDEY